MKKAQRSERRLELTPDHIRIPAVQSIGRYNYPSAKLEGLAAHQHPGAMEFCYLARGQQTYETRGERYALTGGDIFITFPGESHSTAGTPEEKGLLYWLIVSMPGKGPFLQWRGREARGFTHALITLPERHFAAPDGTGSLLEQVIDTICNETVDLKRLRSCSLVSQLLLSLVDASHRKASPDLSKPIQKSINLMSKEISGWQPVAELAEIAELSVSRFKERFRQETGLPPGEFMLRKKIDAAKELLTSSNESITGIAFSLGFSTSQYFSTVFKRFTGRTPRQHRSRQV